MPRERGESGQYTATVEPGDVLGVFDAVGGPAVTSADVADVLGVTRETGRRKLNELVEDGTLASRKTAGRVIYWRRNWRPSPPPADERHEDAPKDDESVPASEPVETTSDRVDGHHGDDSAPESGERERAGEVIDGLDLPGSGAKYDRRREAVLMMHDHLRTNPGEWHQKGDFRELLDGVDVGYESFGSLWSNWVKGSGDKPNVLEVLPGVELAGNEYQYRLPENGGEP